MAVRHRCPGCGHTCCPYPGLECGGDSDRVRECEREALADAICRGCGWSLSWPLSHGYCDDLPVVVPPATTGGGV